MQLEQPPRRRPMMATSKIVAVRPSGSFRCGPICRSERERAALYPHHNHHDSRGGLFACLYTFPGLGCFLGRYPSSRNPRFGYWQFARASSRGRSRLLPNFMMPSSLRRHPFFFSACSLRMMTPPDIAPLRTYNSRGRKYNCESPCPAGLQIAQRLSLLSLCRAGWLKCSK